MLIGVFSGLQSGHLYDPYTGEAFSQKESQARWCFDEASRLLQEAGRLPELTRKWDEPAKQWTGKCGAEHRELQQLVIDARADLRVRKKSGSADREPTDN